MENLFEVDKSLMSCLQVPAGPTYRELHCKLHLPDRCAQFLWSLTMTLLSSRLPRSARWLIHKWMKIKSRTLRPLTIDEVTLIVFLLINLCAAMPVCCRPANSSAVTLYGLMQQAITVGCLGTKAIISVNFNWKSTRLDTITVNVD